MSMTAYVHKGTLRTCARCRLDQRIIAARGLCHPCYQYVRAHHEVDLWPRMRGAS